MEKTLLEVHNLQKHFPIKISFFSPSKGSVKAVHNVSFSLKRGETLGLVGESGCGKSTVGKTILQLHPPTGGRVLFDGKLLFDIENRQRMGEKELLALRKDMQMIFQDPYACLDPRMNIFQILTEGLRKHQAYSRGELWEKAQVLLETSGLGRENLLKYPHQFSGGQRQRIGIARALSLNPKFIICDEPTAALDVSIQSQILNLMLRLKEDYQLSYLFISHDLHVVRHFCDRICVMYLGSILEENKAHLLFENPRHPYTKALLSSITDFTEGKAKKRILLNGELPSPSNLPTGCLFHTRCPEGVSLCQEVPPPLLELGGQSKCACHQVKS